MRAPIPSKKKKKGGRGGDLSVSGKGERREQPIAFTGKSAFSPLPAKRRRGGRGSGKREPVHWRYQEQIGRRTPSSSFRERVIITVDIQKREKGALGDHQGPQQVGEKRVVSARGLSPKGFSLMGAAGGGRRLGREPFDWRIKGKGERIFGKISNTFCHVSQKRGDKEWGAALQHGVDERKGRSAFAIWRNCGLRIRKGKGPKRLTPGTGGGHNGKKRERRRSAELSTTRWDSMGGEDRQLQYSEQQSRRPGGGGTIGAIQFDFEGKKGDQPIQGWREDSN